VDDDALDAALRARIRSERDAERERMRREVDGMLSPPEKRGIARLLARIVAWVGKVIGR
jgi:hypothetical protein